MPERWDNSEVADADHRHAKGRERRSTLDTALRFVAAVSGLLMLVAILMLGWHQAASGDGQGGAYSAGPGLWGVGVRLPRIIPMVILAVGAVAVAGTTRTTRIAGICWITIGLALSLMVVVADRGGVGFAWAMVAACTLMSIGILLAVGALSRGGYVRSAPSRA
jgi:hypothetical protein